ncbi:MAG TPA: DinB family protein [Candidatus Limnocylindrales bacterium]
MSAVALLRYLMDEAFDGRGIEASNEAQSLMANLATVEQGHWQVRLPGSVRTIGSIAVHVGSCKVMYADHAFAAGRLTWDSPEVAPWPEFEAPLAGTLDWLRSSHEALMRHVEALTDDDLEQPRNANWGEARETRWLLSTLLQHDAYHAGEINRMRALLAGEDRWQWQISLGVDPLPALATAVGPEDAR